MDYLKIIPINLKHRSMRTWLTLMGVIIGVVAIMLMLGIGDGLKFSITKELDQFGAQNIAITPGSLTSLIGHSTSASQGKLYLNDVDRIKRIPGVDFTSVGLPVSGKSIQYKDQEVNMIFYGFESDFFAKKVIPQYKIERGRFFKDSETNVVIIGNAFANTVFDKPVNVGSNIYIGGEKFRVVGILQKIGGLGGSNDDQTIIISYNDARKITDKMGTVGSDELGMIYVRVSEGFEPETVADRISFELRSSHKVSEDDFTIITAEYLLEQVNSIIGVLNLFLGAVAGISLLVSAVGVSNTMFTAVLERTKEIGVMKSFGARDNQVMLMFLTESSLLCTFGGIVGVIISIIIILLFNSLSSVFAWGLEGVISPYVILLSLVFSFVIGIIAGVFPALQAAKLNPIEALRYE